MQYYIFRQKTLGVKGGAAAIDSTPKEIDSLDWISGKIMPTTDNPTPLVLDLSLESGAFRGAIIDGLVTLYHKLVKDALLEFGINNIQYYPVTLRHQDTGEEEKDRYVLINILDVLDCVDMEKSKAKMWPSGRGFDFESIVIDESKTNGLHIFRLKDDPTKVIITEDFKNFLDEKKLLVGVKLIKTEDYSDF